MDRYTPGKTYWNVPFLLRTQLRDSIYLFEVSPVKFLVNTHSYFVIRSTSEKGLSGVFANRLTDECLICELLNGIFTLIYNFDVIDLFYGIS